MVKSSTKYTSLLSFFMKNKCLPCHSLHWFLLLVAFKRPLCAYFEINWVFSYCDFFFVIVPWKKIQFDVKNTIRFCNLLCDASVYCRDRCTKLHIFHVCQLTDRWHICRPYILLLMITTVTKLCKRKNVRGNENSNYGLFTEMWSCAVGQRQKCKRISPFNNVTNGLWDRLTNRHCNVM